MINFKKKTVLTVDDASPQNVISKSKDDGTERRKNKSKKSKSRSKRMKKKIRKSLVNLLTRGDNTHTWVHRLMHLDAEEIDDIFEKPGELGEVDLRQLEQCLETKTTVSESKSSDYPTEEDLKVLIEKISKASFVEESRDQDVSALLILNDDDDVEPELFPTEEGLKVLIEKISKASFVEESRDEDVSALLILNDDKLSDSGGDREDDVEPELFNDTESISSSNKDNEYDGDKGTNMISCKDTTDETAETFSDTEKSESDIGTGTGVQITDEKRVQEALVDEETNIVSNAEAITTTAGVNRKSVIESTEEESPEKAVTEPNSFSNPFLDLESVLAVATKYNSNTSIVPLEINKKEMGLLFEMEKIFSRVFNLAADDEK